MPYRPPDVDFSHPRVHDSDTILLPGIPPRLSTGALPKGYALRPSTAYIVTDMLQEVVRSGTAKGARSLERPIAGKTGTTNDSRDGWFIGYSPSLVCGVWVGNDGNHPMGDGETGGRAALPIFRDVMAAAHDGQRAEPFPVPPGVYFERINANTGDKDPKGRYQAFALGDSTSQRE